MIQPHKAGPFTFGNVTAVQSGSTAKPGAFSITTVYSDPDDVEATKDLSRDTALERVKMEGFIGITMLRLGQRGVTVTAWEKPEHACQVLGSKTHREAMQNFWKHLGTGAYTSLWIPDHINTMWVRCPACGKMVDAEKQAGSCGCGRDLSATPPHF